MTDAEKFLLALVKNTLPDNERIIVCGFVGSPNDAKTHAWVPRPWRPGNEIVLADKANGYCTVASFFRASDGSFRRRTDCFAAGYALMVDDVFTKVIPKPDWPKPSCVIETSPGNFQWWYFLNERCADAGLFDGIIRAFIAGELLGKDPGMAGINRVGRLPGYVNGKPQHHGFVTKMHELNQERRYTTDELIENFGLKITGDRYLKRDYVWGTPEDVLVRRISQFSFYHRWLRKHNMLKTQGADPSGWTQIHCPWTENHTNKADTGAAIREPAMENEFYGAFRCHHGHCNDKGLTDIADWILDQEAQAQNEINANDPGFDRINSAVVILK